MKPAAIVPLLAGTGILLGAGLPLAKLAAAHGVGALAFTLWPTAAASLLLALLAGRRHGVAAFTPGVIRYGVIAGLIGHALPMSAVFWLSAHAGAGHAALAFTLPPVFTLAIGLLLRHERLRAHRLAAVTLGFGGALLLIAGGDRDAELTPLAVALMLLIPALIGAGNVYRARFMPKGVATEWLAALTLAASALMLSGVGLVTGRMAVDTQGVVGPALVAQTVAMVGGYILYFELQKRAEPVTFSFIGYLMMATGVAVGVGLMGETLPWTTVPALALILGALLMVRRSAPFSVASRSYGAAPRSRR